MGHTLRLYWLICSSRSKVGFIISADKLRRLLSLGGSFSIKSVLPALFPGDPQLDYHALSGLCQNGGDAMNLFPSIAKMTPEDAAAAREALLRYCELDTLAMVKVWEKLKGLSIILNFRQNVSIL